MADSKLSALSAITKVDDADLVYIVDDPGGTPASKKVTVGELLKRAARMAVYPPFTPTGSDDEFDDGSFSGWTAVNSGSHNPTITEQNDVASFLMPGSDAAAELHAYVKSQSMATNDWIEICLNGRGYSQNYCIAGLLFADGATYTAGNQALFYASQTESTCFFRRFTGYNTSTASTNLSNNPGLAPGGHNLFLRWKYLGSNQYRGYLSPDGISWVDISGAVTAATFTPTHLGFFFSTWGGANAYAWAVRYVRFGNG